MKAKKSGIFKLIGIVLVIAFLVFTSVWGLGSGKTFSAKKIKQGLDLAGGVSITYQTVEDEPSDETMQDVRNKLERRAGVYSTEAAVYQEGTNRVTVDIPGVGDAEAILKDLGNPGALYFIYGEGNIERTGVKEYKLTKTIDELREQNQIILEGKNIADAKGTKAQTSSVGSLQNIVELKFDAEGTEKFAIASANSIGKVIAIVYDGEVISAPVVNTVIDKGECYIEGQETIEEAQNLASVIRIGALPTELVELRSNIVTAQLGAEAISTSLLAFAVGFALLIIFMIAYYRVPGIAASLALTIYVGLMVGILSVCNVTLTLQGVAGIILSVGMAVDANVVIFQRIREELAKGLTVRSAIRNGFKKALSAIIDGNVTTLIAAAVLYIMTSGGIKGFATTLAIGIVISMLTALYITKFILGALYDLGLDKESMYGIQKERKTINFVKHGPKFAVISVVLIVAGFVAMGVHGANGNALNYGLDFSGGTSVEATFPENVNITNVELEKFVSDTLGVTGEITKVTGENTYIMRTKELSQEQRATLTSALTAKYGVESSLIKTENISGRISAEMRSDAIRAVIVAVICMLIYIWWRFKNFNFASSAVIALVHDVLVVLMLYAVARIAVGNNFIACMLTIVGYSINATIIIFDRIRENLAEKSKKESVKDVVNKSITQTLSRSINTSLTTFVMVLALVVFGVDSIKEFAIPLMFGIVVGAYSSVCITGSLWYFMETKVIKHVEEKEN